MSDWWLFQLVLLLLYLSSCVLWVRPNSLLAEIRPGGRLTLRLPSYQFCLFDRLPVLLNPLKPWRVTVPVEPLQICVSPAGIVCKSIQELRPPPWPQADCPLVSWGEIDGIWSDKSHLHLGKQTLVRTASPAMATAWAKHLRVLWSATQDERCRLIDSMLDEFVDAEGCRAKLQTFDESARPLQWMSTYLLVSMFGLLPLTIEWLPQWRSLVLGAIALAWIGCLYKFLHAASLCNLSRERKRWSLLTMIFEPPTAIRASQRLSEVIPTCPGWNCLGLLAITEDHDDVHAVIRDVECPLQESDTNTSGVIDWFRGRFRTRLQRFDHYERLRVHAVRPPTAHDADVRTYCPRCQGQYRTSATSQSCLNCGSVLLRPWPPFES